jgi:hypothetical protein
MPKKARSLCLTLVVLLFSSLTEWPLTLKASFSSDILTAMEITALVSGKTAEVAFAKNEAKGLFFFDSNGELKKLANNWLERGSWWVKENDRLCLRIDGESWECRMLLQDTGGIGQYVAKKDGNHQHELAFEHLTEGNLRFDRAIAASPPLEKLNKEEIIKLFSDKTVESQTVRKGRVSVAYYHPDGTLELLRKGVKHYGVWRVTDEDRMCLGLEGSIEKCRIIVKQGSSYGKYIVKKSGKHQQSISYRWFKQGKQF